MFIHLVRLNERGSFHVSVVVVVVVVAVAAGAAAFCMSGLHVCMEITKYMYSVVVREVLNVFTGYSRVQKRSSVWSKMWGPKSDGGVGLDLSLRNFCRRFWHRYGN
jgi:hypothetical protein